jgi:predicted GNAT family N-acyltransferase
MYPRKNDYAGIPRSELQSWTKAVPQSAQVTEIDLGLLQAYCRQAHFEPGALLRQKGQHYADMYLITAGIANVDLEAGNIARLKILATGSPIGEIGFLRGCPATATVTAETAIDALVIDDPTFARLENEQHAWNAHFLRSLAEIAEERTSLNLTFVVGPTTHTKSDDIEIFLCRNRAMLASAQRLRYEVYVGELGRNSPHADHELKTIADELDHTGNTFVAIEAGETTATMRMNLSFRGSIGAFEELYGMKHSAHHPKSTAICTKFIVKESKRGSQTWIKLLTAAGRFAARNNIRELYIDCIPTLVQYYEALGFRVVGPSFLHRENGPSYPMMKALS